MLIYAMSEWRTIDIESYLRELEDKYKLPYRWHVTSSPSGKLNAFVVHIIKTKNDGEDAVVYKGDLIPVNNEYDLYHVLFEKSKIDLMVYFFC